jgi:copper chaperone CopZ
METKELDVGGISCSNCAQHIEKEVGQLKGVQTVQVSLMTNSMKVTLMKQK